MRLIALLSALLMFTVQAKPIAESADEVSPLLNGQMVPDVAVTTIDNQKLPLADYLDGKKTVLFFYRGGWCPFCNTQMGQLKQVTKPLADMGFQLVGISTDAPADLQKSVEKNALDYELLSDFGSDVSQAFGLAFFNSAKTTKRYVERLGLTNQLKENKAGEKRLVLPAPAIYVIDSNGLVQFNYVNPNFRVRLHPEILLKAASLVE